MPDLALVWNQTLQCADWQIVNGDLAQGADLQTAVIKSLFTDRVAEASYVNNDGSQNRRGWWGDSYRPRLIGSRLWQLKRAVKSNSTGLLAQAQTICEEALQWLIDDRVASKVTVICNYTTPTMIAISVVITEPTTNNKIKFQFGWAWSQITS